MLPIDDALPALRAALVAGPRAVLQAPPGAGKTTVVPLALQTEAWAREGRIVMLEPRRLAARAAARRMAATTGGRVGELVGFRVRGESQVSRATRIEVVTEGVLTRMLASDPTLDGVAGVIFDEFHERSLIADTGLALTLRTAEMLRPELRILVMSATLDGEGVSRLLGGAPIVSSQGRMHAVETRWLPPRGDVRPVDFVPVVVRKALEESAGDILVFLPGAGEIARVEGVLRGTLPADVHLFALHGSLANETQDEAIAPSRPGARKIVLATSIAETSLTIEGVRVVIDSGLARVPRFDPRSGMTRLETVRVPRDSAEQRRGRAGRTDPGVCYRLWSEGDDAALLARRTPEILSADLAPMLLDLASAGVGDPGELRWLDGPPAGALARARELLTELDALAQDGSASRHGRAMSDIGLHPRLAHMVIHGAERGEARLACELAALLTERDILARSAHGDGPDPNIDTRLAVLRGDDKLDSSRADRGRVMRAREEARRLLARVAGTRPARDRGTESAAELLALAYPDRVALQSGARGRFRMRNGRGATVSDSSPLASTNCLAIAETDGARDDARVFLAAELDRAALERLFGHQITETSDTSLDTARGTVTTVRRRSLGALVLSEHSERATDPIAVGEAFAARVRRDGIASIPWSDAARRVRERLAFIHSVDSQWPDVSDGALVDAIDTWLAPALGEIKRFADLERADLGAALLALVPPKLRRNFDELAPTHLEVATGSRIPIDYADPKAPSISVRMQELFGTAISPRVGGGRVAVVLHLLSPAGRPLQVTRDLAGFWSGSYAEVRKEMRGRYPRHSWPEDPRNAPATRRAKPRR
jgi:ATP-dependent helicase HrpB